MHHNHIYPSFSWVIENAAAFDYVREEKRHAPTFFPAPSILWVPKLGNRRARVFLGPPSPYYPFCRRARRHRRRPPTPKIRAIKLQSEVPYFSLDEFSPAQSGEVLNEESEATRDGVTQDINACGASIEAVDVAVGIEINKN